MDRLVKARFYQIENVEENARAFDECLAKLWGRRDRAVYHDLGV